MSATAVVRCNGRAKELTLEAGVEPDHLRAMLKDAFSLQAVPVALTATADGTVLPMSLVAREPSLLDGGDYTIVLAKRPPALLAGSVPTPFVESPSKSPQKGAQRGAMGGLVDDTADDEGVLPISDFDPAALVALFERRAPDGVDRGTFHTVLGEYMRNVRAAVCGCSLVVPPGLTLGLYPLSCSWVSRTRTLNRAVNRWTRCLMCSITTATV